MSHSAKNLSFLIFSSVFMTVPAVRLYAEGQSDWKQPLFSPTALLIRDQAIRVELRLDETQTKALNQLCEELNPLLFAMRDVPADTTDRKAIQRAAQITEKLKQLDHILNSRQQQRLAQLRTQYEGFESLLYPRLHSQLKLTTEQVAQIRQIHTQSLARQQKVIQQKPDEQDAMLVQKQIQKILGQQAQQIRRVMGDKQYQQWQAMLGEAFDFSQTQPVSFRVPELQNVTAWINTGPLSMKDLRGRVVVVHFWTFGCGNCIQNYPVYKQWTKQYDPKEVLVLGIHTPEAEYEKNLKMLKNRIEQEGLSFAVAVDNDKANWNAWSNRVWPSVYLVDKKGRVRFWWYGELRWQGATGDQWITQRIQQLRAEQ